MKHLFRLICGLFVLCFIQIYFNQALAIDVVYPSKNNSVIKTANAFIVGNVGNDVSFEINNETVELHEDGAFVYYTPLKYGANLFVMKSVDAAGKASVLKYVINRPLPPPPANIRSNLAYTATSASSNIEEFEEFLIAKITKDYMPLRDGPKDTANRLVHPKKGTYLNLDAKNGNYYRVYINDETKFWIKEGTFAVVHPRKEPMLSNISAITYTEDRKYKYINFKTDRAVPYKLIETGDGLSVSMYNISAIPENMTKALKNPKLENNIFTFVVPNKINFGYKMENNDGEMVLRLANPPCVHNTKPLRCMSIAIDAGHGGTDGGSIGPTRVRESDIVLDIAQRVERMLKHEGASVLMTRTENKNVGLYDRIDMITEFNPSVSISIHANALPDGVNPYERYGSSVYYYHPQAKPLAKSINDKLVVGLKTRDDGVRFGNFVLTRMSDPVAVLVETAYMINPYDYEKLTKPRYRYFAAKAIVEGLKEYVLSVGVGEP